MENISKTKAREIILKNISEAFYGLLRKELMYDAHVKELAYLLVSEACEEPFYGVEQLADRLRGLFYLLVQSEDVSHNEFESMDFRVRFCAFAAEELCLRGTEPPDFDDFDKVFDGGISIARFSNSASDKAYEKFSEVLPRARQVICESIASVCEEVADGRCDMCLLPIYSSADGLMQNIYRQAVRYGLSAVMSVDMPSDGDLFVRYFLFSATPCKRENASTVTLTVVPERASEISFLPTALMKYGAVLEDITSLSPSLYEGNQAFRFTFSVKNADIMKIYLFLQINFPRFEINGIYEKLDTE